MYVVLPNCGTVLGGLASRRWTGHLCVASCFLLKQRAYDSASGVRETSIHLACMRLVCNNARQCVQ